MKAAVDIVTNSQYAARVSPGKSSLYYKFHIVLQNTSNNKIHTKK